MDEYTHDVYCTLYSIQCTMYIVQCTMYILQCTMYIIQCTYSNGTHVRISPSNWTTHNYQHESAIYTIYGVHMHYIPLWGIICKLYIGCGIVDTDHHTLYTVQRTLYSIHWILYIYWSTDHTGVQDAEIISQFRRFTLSLHNT